MKTQQQRQPPAKKTLLHDPLDRFVKAAEMAQYLPFSDRKIYDLAKLDPPEIPCYKYRDPISHRVYVSFHLGETLAWFREFRAGPRIQNPEKMGDSRQ